MSGSAVTNPFLAAYHSELGKFIFRIERFTTSHLSVTQNRKDLEVLASLRSDVSSRSRGHLFLLMQNP
jgi:hypothetical protein